MISMNIDWKVYSALAGVALLVLMALFINKLFFFLIISLATVLVALILRFGKPLKYMGVELITLTTMIVGAAYGPIIGGVYAFSFLLIQLVLGDYYIGTYLVWVLPEYVLLGVISGVFASNLNSIGIVLIIGLNVTNLIFTFLSENERFFKELPYAIGNSMINSVLFMQFFASVINLIG